MSESSPPAVPSPASAAAGWRLENSYASLPKVFHFAIAPVPVRAPRLVVLNRPLAESLGLAADSLDGAIFAGNALPPGASPLAQAYAGHQFGEFHHARRRAGDIAGRANHAQRRALRHPAQRLRPHAVFPRRRRPGGAGADAARIHHQRGDARARHPDHPQPRGGDDR